MPVPLQKGKSLQWWFWLKHASVQWHEGIGTVVNKVGAWRIDQRGIAEWGAYGSPLVECWGVRWHETSPVFRHGSMKRSTSKQTQCRWWQGDAGIVVLGRRLKAQCWVAHMWGAVSCTFIWSTFGPVQIPYQIKSYAFLTASTRAYMKGWWCELPGQRLQCLSKLKQKPGG